MKIRTDFVTNSSSSSFVACGILSDELASFILDLLKGKHDSYSNYQVGGLHIDGNIISTITVLDIRDSFYLYRQDERDRRSDKQRQSDDAKAVKPENLAEIMEAFLPRLTPEQKEEYKRLIKDAAESGLVRGRTYIDETDGFDWCYYSSWDFGVGSPRYRTDYDVRNEKSWLEKYGDLITKDPLIYFPDSVFVCSGLGWGDDGKSHPLVDKILEKGGIFRGKVSGRTNYLVVDPTEAGDSKITVVQQLREKGIFVDVILVKDLEKALEENSSAEQLANIKTKVLEKREREAEARRLQKEREEELRRPERERRAELRRIAAQEKRLEQKQEREVQKAEEKAERDAHIAELLLSMKEQCEATGTKYSTMAEFWKDSRLEGLKFLWIEQHIQEHYQQKIEEYLMQNGMLMTEKERILAQIEEVLKVLTQRYAGMNKKAMSVRDVVKENPDVDMRVLTEHAAFYTGKTPRVLLTERGIIYRDEELQPEDAPISHQVDPAQIPENIRKRMDTLFAKLDETYPDKVIMRLNQDHKQWAKTVTELYRLLGYESPKDFLTAYGYTYGSTDDKGGRPKKNPMEIIEELQRRYPNGTDFTTVDELKAANPDIASRFQSLRNKSNEYFGMPFTQYLRSIGLIK